MLRKLYLIKKICTSSSYSHFWHALKTFRNSSNTDALPLNVKLMSGMIQILSILSEDIKCSCDATLPISWHHFPPSIWMTFMSPFPQISRFFFGSLSEDYSSFTVGNISALLKLPKNVYCMLGAVQK